MTGPEPGSWLSSLWGRWPAVDRGQGAVVAWAKTFFEAPSRVAAGFWGMGAIGVAAVLPLESWPQYPFLAMVAMCVVAGLSCVGRLATGRRLPRWTLHVDVAGGTLLVTLLVIVSAQSGINFAYFYIWVGLFSAVYFRPLAVGAFCAAVAVLYAVALAYNPGGQQPVAAWLGLVGTMSTAAAMVLGLMTGLRRSAAHDPLTGLANRRWWDERLEEELERSRRTHAALSVVVIDLDGFKVLNDTVGHHAGDRLLRELARAWRGVVRSGGDFLARLGGDEFGLLASGTDAQGAQRLAGRLAAALPAGVEASMGIAAWDGSESAAELVRRADQAMYAAKRSRRGQANAGR